MKSIRRFSLSGYCFGHCGRVWLQQSQRTRNHNRNIRPAHKVLWASAVLPPGDYAFSLDTQSLPARVSVRHVDGPIVGMILPQTISEDDFVGGSSLILHQEGGESSSDAAPEKHRHGAGICLCQAGEASGGNGRIGADRRFSISEVEVEAEAAIEPGGRFRIFYRVHHGPESGKPPSDVQQS